jgi:hypothetical protein
VGRHNHYFNLVDACERRGCPVCRLALASVYRWLDSFAYEGVNDPDVRAALRASRGFCPVHAWQLVDEIHDVVGAAIVYRDVIHTLLPHVTAAVHHPAALSPAGVCRACLVLDEAARRYLDVLAESLPDREFRRACETGPGALCVPHAQAVLQRLASRAMAEAAAEWLAARWETALQAPRGSAQLRPGARRYRGVAGLTGTISAASFAAPEPASLSDPRTLPVEMLFGRPRAVTPAGGPRAAGQARLPPAPERAEGALAWDHVCVSGACAVCRLALRAEDRPPTGNGAAGPLAVADVRSLCNAHAWRLVERGYAAALGPACETAIRELARDLRGTSAPHRGCPNGASFALAALFDRSTPGERLAARLAAPGECRWCVDRAEAEAATLDRLLAEDGHVTGAQEALCRSGGVCRAHFVRAMERGQGSAAAAWLACLQLERWSALDHDLEEYLRKQDYRFRDEPRGPEQTAPWRAVEQVAGARGWSNS